MIRITFMYHHKINYSKQIRKEEIIIVKQVNKEEATKDGWRWIFYNYLYLNDRPRKNINPKSLRQEMKLLKLNKILCLKLREKKLMLQTWLLKI